MLIVRLSYTMQLVYVREGGHISLLTAAYVILGFAGGQLIPWLSVYISQCRSPITTCTTEHGGTKYEKWLRGI